MTGLRLSIIFASLSGLVVGQDSPQDSATTSTSLSSSDLFSSSSSSSAVSSTVSAAQSSSTTYVSSLPSSSSATTSSADQTSSTTYDSSLSTSSTTTTTAVQTTSTTYSSSLSSSSSSTTTLTSAVSSTTSAPQTSSSTYSSSLSSSSSSTTTLSSAVSSTTSAPQTSSSTYSSSLSSVRSSSSSLSSSTTSSSTSLTTLSTVTSSASSATPTPTQLTCPLSNNTQYTASSGAIFLIECYIDHAGGDLAMKSVASLQQCVETCDQTSGCVDVSFQAGWACYMKASVGTAKANSIVLGARRISPLANGQVVPSCPSSNGTIYYDTSSGVNKTFAVECGIDYATTADEDLGGPYYGSTIALWLTECIGRCANTANCVDIKLSGSACYLRSNIIGRDRISETDTFGGARLLSPLPAPSPVASTTVTSIRATSTTKTSTKTSSTSAALAATSSAAVCKRNAPQCPACDGQQISYELEDGSTNIYRVQCGIDYSGGDIPGGGNGYYSVYAFLNCISTCGDTPGCVTATFQGAACYLKGSIAGGRRNNTVAWNALLVDTIA